MNQWPKPARLRELSATNISGRRIAPHRAIHRLEFPAQRWLSVLLLPAVFDLLVWAGRGPLAEVWASMFQMWLPLLELGGEVTRSSADGGWLGLALPWLALPSRVPSTLEWWSIAAVTGIALIGSRWLDEAWLPARYLVVFVAVIQVSALAFFATIPAAFPYSVPDYLNSQLVGGLWMMLVLPWVHGLIYYVFGFALWQKAALTTLSLAFLAAAVPFQALSHALLLVEFSLLLLPVLYLVFGILPLMLGCVGLYGWAMSWRRSDDEAGSD